MDAKAAIDEIRPTGKADEARLRDAGFRWGPKGTHTSRTIMLDELRALLAHCRPTATRTDFLAAEGIDRLPSLSVGSEADLIRSLEQTALPAWKPRTDALPQQFTRAAMAAAKLLEPKTQRVHLASGTLKTEQEVKAWLAETAKGLMAKLKNGPVVTS